MFFFWGLPPGKVEAARDVLRALRQHDGGRLIRSGARVLLHPGIHQPFSLGPEDSGAPGARIIYEAAQPWQSEPAMVSGGVCLLFNPATSDTFRFPLLMSPDSSPRTRTYALYPYIKS